MIAIADHAALNMHSDQHTDASDQLLFCGRQAMQRMIGSQRLDRIELGARPEAGAPPSRSATHATHGALAIRVGTLIEALLAADGASGQLQSGRTSQELR